MIKTGEKMRKNIFALLLVSFMTFSFAFGSEEGLSFNPYIGYGGEYIHYKSEDATHSSSYDFLQGGTVLGASMIARLNYPVSLLLDFSMMKAGIGIKKIEIDASSSTDELEDNEQSDWFHLLLGVSRYFTMNDHTEGYIAIGPDLLMSFKSRNSETIKNTIGLGVGIKTGIEFTYSPSWKVTASLTGTAVQNLKGSFYEEQEEENSFFNSYAFSFYPSLGFSFHM